MPSIGRIGVDPAAFSNIFTPKYATGPIGAAAASQRLDQGGEPLKTLSRAVGAATVSIVDSADISAAARVAAAISQRNGTLTNSDGGPQGVRPIHPVIDGKAQLSQNSNILSGGGK